MKKTQNLENLHVFCEIVRTGSVKAASDALNTETSNAFRTVRQLEDELGVALFDREKRPMQLTSYGTQFYRYSSKILKLHHQMLEELKDDTDAMAGRITVCSTAGFRQQFLTPSLVEFQMDHPNIVIDLREMNSGVSDVLNSATESGNDVVLMYKPKSSAIEPRKPSWLWLIKCRAASGTVGRASRTRCSSASFPAASSRRSSSRSQTTRGLESGTWPQAIS